MNDFQVTEDIIREVEEMVAANKARGYHELPPLESFDIIEEEKTSSKSKNDLIEEGEVEKTKKSRRLPRILSDLQKKEVPVYNSYYTVPKHSISVSKLEKEQLRHNNSLIGIVSVKGRDPYYIYDKRDAVSRTRLPKGAVLYKNESDIPEHLKTNDFLKKIGMRHSGIVSGILKPKGKKSLSAEKVLSANGQKYSANRHELFAYPK